MRYPPEQFTADVWQTIYTPPGQEHWHDATPEDFMEHLAVTENGDAPATTTNWHEHVADEGYYRP